MRNALRYEQQLEWEFSLSLPRQMKFSRFLISVSTIDGNLATLLLFCAVSSFPLSRERVNKLNVWKISESSSEWERRGDGTGCYEAVAAELLCRISRRIPQRSFVGIFSLTAAKNFKENVGDFSQNKLEGIPKISQTLARVYFRINNGRNSC